MTGKEALESPYAWRVETGKLDNGLSHTLHPMPWAYSVASQFSILAGPRYMICEHSAIPHANEHLSADNAFGYGSYDAVEDAFELRSGRHEEYTTQEVVGGETKLFPRHSRFGLEFCRALYFETPLLSENIPLEMQIVQNEKLRGLDKPSTRLEGRMSSFMWPGYGVEYGVDGSLQSIQEQLTQENFIRYRENFMWADRSSLKVAGNFDVSEMHEAIAQVFGGLPKRDAAHPEPPAPLYVRAERGVFIEQFKSKLVYIGLKFQINPQNLQTDHDLNLLLTQLVERQAYGRLVNELGIAYAVEATVETFRDFGTVYFETAVKSEFTEAAVRELIGSVNFLKTDPETVEKRIGALKTKHLLDMDAPDERIEFLDDFPNRTPEQVNADFDDLQKQDLSAGKARLFQTGNAAMGVLGPVSPSLTAIFDEMLHFSEQPQRIEVSPRTILVPSLSSAIARRRQP